MKKNALTTALAAGLVGVAGIASVSNAVNLNPDGVGQALVYPYYTVNAGNATLMSIVNTTSDGKALKVAIKEGLDSTDIFDFNLYLSPFDVWTASIASQAAADSIPIIATGDTSCTVPNLIAPRAELAPVTISPGVFGVPLRNGVAAAVNRREGYITIVEMGELVDDEAGSLSAATHFGGGSPSNCAQLVDAWAPSGTRNYWSVSPGRDIRPPTGGLFGNGSIINVGEGRMNGYAADALNSFSAIGQHSDPSNNIPNLANANTAGIGQFVDSVVFDSENNRAVLSRWTNGAQAVSAVFMANKVINEYATTIGTGGSAGVDPFDSEWVLTFPTKTYHVTSACNGFAAAFVAPYTSCSPNFFTNLYDRNEESFNPQPGSPGPLLSLRREVQVIGFNDEGGTPSDILGSPGMINIEAPTFTEGWAEVFFGTRVSGGSGTSSFSMTSTAGTITPLVPISSYRGLPVTGFWAFSANNTQGLPGVRAFYGDFFKHRTEKRITTL